MKKDPPFRILPILPYNVPTLYSHLAAEFDRAFHEQRRRPDKQIEIEYKLGSIHAQRAEDRPLLQLLQRTSEETPLLLRPKVLPFFFESNLSEDLFIRIEEYFEQLSRRKRKSCEYDFYGQIGESSLEARSLRKSEQVMRLDLRAGGKRYEFDVTGGKTVTVKKNVFDHSDILAGKAGVRLSKNLEQRVNFDEAEFWRLAQGKLFFRLKLVKRFIKNEWVEFSLSSILQKELDPDSKGRDSFKAELLEAIRDDTLSTLLPSLMSELFDSGCRFHKKFQVQAELLPRGMAENDQAAYALAKAMFEDVVSLGQAKNFTESKWLRKLGLEKWGPESHWRVIGNYLHETLLSGNDPS